MATNYKPMIKGNDYGIWRRLKLIPFTVRVNQEKQDKHLEEKLFEERQGILNWLIEGARLWISEGLNTPNEISNATEEYREEMDAFGGFVKECCVTGPDYSVKARDIYNAYVEWCGKGNEHICSERFMAMRLKELGLERSRTSEARYWTGIALKQ